MYLGMAYMQFHKIIIIIVIMIMIIIIIMVGSQFFNLLITKLKTLPFKGNFCCIQDDHFYESQYKDLGKDKYTQGGC